MTKAELIEALKDFPDNMNIRIGVEKHAYSNGAYAIDRIEVVDDGLVKLNPGGFFYNDEEE